MGQSAGGGAPPSSSTPPGTGGFGRFNMAAIQPSPGKSFRGPEPAVVPPNATSGQIGAASTPRAPANANLLDPQILQSQAAAMGRSMSGTPFGGRPDPSTIYTRPGAPMSLSGTAGPRPSMARPPMYAMSTPNLSAPMYSRPSSPMPSSFGAFNTAFLGRPSALGMMGRRFAEGGSTGLGSGTTPQSGGMFKGANLAAAHNSINSYLSQSNPSATQAAIASAMANMYGPRQSLPPPRTAYRPEYVDYGLGATPQAQQFAIPSKMSIPTPDRPGSMGGSRLQRPVASGMPKQTQKADPNLTILNQTLGPQKPAYDSDGNRYQPMQYMDRSQRDALLANPSAYLDYAKYIQGGGDPTKFQRSAQPVSMMTTAQRDAFTKKQRAELARILPPAYVEDSGGA